MNPRASGAGRPSSRTSISFGLPAHHRAKRGANHGANHGSKHGVDCGTAQGADLAWREQCPLARDVARAMAWVRGLKAAPEFICADMCSTALAPSDGVLILDALRYVRPEAQLAWLARVRGTLLRHGRLLLRVGNLGNARRFATRQWVGRLITLARRHPVAPTFGRAVTDWVALLCELGSTVRSLLMSQGTPVAKVLLVADL